MSRKCPKCYLPIGDYDDHCPNCGANTPPEGGQRPTLLADEADVPMKWFKFLTNFLLFAAALLGLYTAYQTYTGAIYDGNAEYAYAILPDLKTVDMAYTVICVLLAAFAVFARFRLSGYYQNGPVLCHIYLAGFGIAPILYALAYSKVWEQIFEDPMSSLAGLWYPAYLTAIASAVLLILNIIYFRKRRDQFVF